MDTHTLDPRLAQDSRPLGETDLNHVRLARDERWPWVILVPKRAGASELHDLSVADQTTLMQEIAIASQALQGSTGCLKVNVAAIGNIVRQLHVHVVGRNIDDPGWPGPIWGFETPIIRPDTELPEFAQAVQAALIR